jgi:hypothetical protein
MPFAGTATTASVLPLSTVTACALIRGAPSHLFPHHQLRKIVSQIFSYLVRSDLTSFATVYVRATPELLALFVKGYDLPHGGVSTCAPSSIH